MRTRFLLVFIVVLGLAGCAGMPTWVAGGTTPPAGTSTDGAVADPVAGGEVGVGDVVTAITPLLPPPWNVIAPIIGSLVVALKKKG